MADYPDDDADDFTAIGDAPPFLLPHFGSGQFVPGSPCPHPRAGYKRGDPCYCVRCDISGRDHYRYFRNRKQRKTEAGSAVSAAAKHAAYVPPKPLKPVPKETRKQRRARNNAAAPNQDRPVAN